MLRCRIPPNFPRSPKSNHRCIPIATQQRALQTRILKIENYEKRWLHHCICKSRKDCKSSRIPNALGKLATILQERGVSAKRTQADRREGLMSSASQATRVTVKPIVMFSPESKSSIFKNTNPSNLGRSLLEGNKDHLLNQARSDLMKRELQVESLNNCISELQQQAHAQRLELQDAQHGYVESRREQVRLQEELSMKEKVLRDTQIRSMHEMGEMQRAQKQRVDESQCKN